MNDEEQVEQRDTPDVAASEAQRNLATILLTDVNTVTTTVVSAVGGAYAIKKVLGGDRPKRGGDQGGDPPEAGPPA
ncbi:MAG TPA: hypothetical protein VLL69_06625 [Streptosporangiaceae bacterium]|nr:hypothetical protein [Streptosporangiaceae bacterium]